MINTTRLDDVLNTGLIAIALVTLTAFLAPQLGSAADTAVQIAQAAVASFA